MRRSGPRNISAVPALVEDTFTPAGVARLNTLLDPNFTQPVGVAVSTASRGGDSPVLGFDVEMAFTNINNAVPDISARLHHLIVVYSGSNRDGSGQSEDNNVLECTYPMLSLTLARTSATTNLVIRWAGNCALQQADALQGTEAATIWTTIPGNPTSPYAVNLMQARRFYRLRDCH